MTEQSNPHYIPGGNKPAADKCAPVPVKPGQGSPRTVAEMPAKGVSLPASIKK